MAERSSSAASLLRKGKSIRKGLTPQAGNVWQLWQWRMSPLCKIFLGVGSCWRSFGFENNLTREENGLVNSEICFMQWLGNYRLQAVYLWQKKEAVTAGCFQWLGFGKHGSGCIRLSLQGGPPFHLYSIFFPPLLSELASCISFGTAHGVTKFMRGAVGLVLIAPTNYSLERANCVHIPFPIFI